MNIKKRLSARGKRAAEFLQGLDPQKRAQHWSWHKVAFSSFVQNNKGTIGHGKSTRKNSTSSSTSKSLVKRIFEGIGKFWRNTIRSLSTNVTQSSGSQQTRGKGIKHKSLKPLKSSKRYRTTSQKTLHKGSISVRQHQ